MVLRSILSARSEAEPRETEEYDHWLMILKLVDQRSPSGIGTPLNRRVRVSEEIIKALRVERSPRTVVHVESWADLEEASRRTGELIVYISKGVRPTTPSLVETPSTCWTLRGVGVGEVFALTWSDVDLERRIIRIAAEKESNLNEAHRDAEPATEKG